MNKFNKLDENGARHIPENYQEVIKDNLWIIESDSKQGTAFLLKNVGFIVEHICVDTPIITGHSGGPIFNKRNEVVGIATRGSSYKDSDKTTNNAFIKINMIEKYM